MIQRRTFLLAAAAALCLSAANAQAATVYFDNATSDGKYETAGNWFDGTGHYLPGVGDTGLIASGLTATLSGDVSASVPDKLYVGYIDSTYPSVSGNGTLTLNDAAAKLKVTSFSLGYSDSAVTQSTGAINLQAGSIATTSSNYIGQGGGAAGGVGTFNQTGGTFTSTGGTLYLGYNANSTGAYNISGDGSTASVASFVYLGYNGNADGSLTVGTEGGADACSFSGTNTMVAYGNGGGASTGTLTVQGAGSFSTGIFSIGGYVTSATAATGHAYIKDSASLSATNFSYIGNYGEGTLEQTGGSASFGSSLYISRGLASKGTYIISGGSLTATNSSSSIFLGYTDGADGKISVSGDAVVELNSKLYIGQNGKGTYEQTGGSTTVNNTVYLANSFSANGTLDVSGGTFSTGANGLYVGFAGVGNVLISGANTSVSAGSVVVGGSTSTNAEGHITQSDGAVFRLQPLHRRRRPGGL